MNLLQIFFAFFMANVLGYGGGPSVIPLIKNEVVDVFGWMSSLRFGEVLAIGNVLPGPIATKMAGYIGYEQGGIAGALAALTATVAPSVAVMIALMRTIMKYKNSPRVQNMTLLVQPAIAAMLMIMAMEFLTASWTSIGSVHSLIIIAAAYMFMERLHVHPFYVILAALFYGYFIL